MFIMYKAVNKIVTELFIYVERNDITVLLESKYSPHNEMELGSDFTDYKDTNAGGSYRRFHLALNKHMSIRSILHIDERDITCFKYVNKWINGGGRRTEEMLQVGGRIKLC